MVESSENQNRSSKNGSDNQTLTLYDQFQLSLSSFEEKSQKGKFSNSVGKLFKAEGENSPSTNKGEKQNETTSISNNKPTQSNTGGECSSSSTKRKIRKTYENPPKVRGFEYDEMSLEMMLLQDGYDDSIRKIGVAGLPGVGKTTLCKSILRNERVKASYPLMIWVSLSEPENKPVEIPETTSDDIMEHISDERETTSDDIMEHISDERKLPELLQRLNEQLKEKKYLLVVDDVGEGGREFRHEDLKACFSNELPKEKGGAVIVISRSEKVIQKIIGDNNLHRLLPLSDPKSCWLIYKDAMDGFTAEDDPGASKDVMLKLMEKCGGLPVAAQMMGKIKAQKRAN